MLLFMAEVRDRMVMRTTTLCADRPIGQLIALRLLIGLFEAGFYPTVLFYLSTFYTRFDLATRIGIFYGQYAIAGAFSGAIGMSEGLIFLFLIVLSISENSPFLAYGIFQLKGALNEWQYLFIIEGSLTVFVALPAFLLLPKEPGSAWFLSAAEREYAAQRIRIDNERYVLKEYGATNASVVSQRLTKRDIIETAKDWKLWSVLVCNICASVPSQAFGIFLPVVVQGMGYSSNQANLVSNFFPTSNLLSFFLVFMLTISPDVRSALRVRRCGLVCCYF
jgi:MFS family permease